MRYYLKVDLIVGEDLLDLYLNLGTVVLISVGQRVGSRFEVLHLATKFSILEYTKLPVLVLVQFTQLVFCVTLGPNLSFGKLLKLLT